MSRYFLGADIGGTKSHVLITDSEGNACGFGRGGPGNPNKVGYEGLAAVLSAAMQEALFTAGISKNKISGAGFGIAGYSWSNQQETFRNVIQLLNLTAPFEVVNDTILGIYAGTSNCWGVSLVAGTHCNCRGWDGTRREGRVTGSGPKMGEAAGASELIGKAVQAVALEWTKRGPRTRLTQAFMELTNAQCIENLIEGLATEQYELPASAAPVIFRLAAEGDYVAEQLILWAGRELGDMAIGVIRQLNFERLSFDVSLSGSFFNGSSQLISAVSQRILTVAPDARIKKLKAPPVIGGVLLGMEKAGAGHTADFETLTESTIKLLEIGN